jgi:hypothetical protein
MPVRKTSFVTPSRVAVNSTMTASSANCGAELSSSREMVLILCSPRAMTGFAAQVEPGEASSAMKIEVAPLAYPIGEDVNGLGNLVRAHCMGDVDNQRFLRNRRWGVRNNTKPQVNHNVI